jgi:hypothetical protein
MDGVVLLLPVVVAVEKVRARATGSSKVAASAPLPLLSITVLRAGMAVADGSGFGVAAPSSEHRAVLSAQRRETNRRENHRNAVSSANTSRARLHEFAAPFFFVCVGSLVLCWVQHRTREGSNSRACTSSACVVRVHSGSRPLCGGHDVRQ